jgi:hypothetical protein
VGDTDGPPPYTESRSSRASRSFGVAVGSVGVPSGDELSNVMSWSRNCPTKVVPAVMLLMT